MPDRDRPSFDAAGPDEPPSVAILSPQTNTTVATPGNVAVQIRVASTFGLLDGVSATAVRFADDSVVARTTLAFSPLAGDTTVTLILDLGTFPNSTQLNLTATATVSGHVARSEDVAVIALDCSQPQIYCP